MRTMLRFTRIVAAGLIGIWSAAMGVGAEAARGAEADRPNVVFFLSDDHRSDLMGCAGHPILKTPTMDRLAENGVRFSHAFVTTSICAASRASILTGLYERTHKFTFGTPPIGADHCAISYPSRLRAAGYRTGFVGKFGVSVAPGWGDKMFDFFKPLNRNPYFKKHADGGSRHVSQIAGDHAIAFLRKQNPQQPFCLSVSFNAPHAEDGDKKNHYPWPKAVDGLYDDLTIPPPHLSEPAVFESQPEFLKESLNRQRWFWRWDTPAKYQKNVKAYFRMISGVDHVMGRVLGELAKLGLSDNTVVVFSGDNGYYLGSRGFAGKWSHYEESLRVPLIVFDPRLPNEQRGRVVDNVVLNVDIAPTILAFAGLEPPSACQGTSLVELARGRPVSSWRTDFFCEHLFAHAAIPKWEGVRERRWVYARYFEQSPPFEFLHDLKDDPQQLKNLAADPGHADGLARMRERCDALRDGYGGPYSPETFPTRGR